MGSLLQRAVTIPRQRKNKMLIDRDDAELFVAWATGAVNQAQVCGVLDIAVSNRASFYSWAASAAKFAVNSGYLAVATPPAS